MIPTKALLRAFRELNSIVPSQSKIKHPALACVRLVSDGVTTTIAAIGFGDPDPVWKRLHLPVDCDRYQVLIPFHLVKRWLNAVSKTCRELTVQALDSGGVRFRGDTFKYEFAAPSIEQFPLMPDEILPVVEPPKWQHVINPFTRRHSHPESGTLEPETSKAYTQLIWQLSEAEPMPEYVIPLDEMKDAVVISLRPDEAYDLTSGATQAIVFAGIDETTFDLIGKYCVVHAAEVSDDVLEESITALTSMEVDPEDAPPGSVLGYGQISALHKYATEEEWQEGFDKGYHVYTCNLKGYQKLLEAEGRPLYGIILSRPIALLEPVEMAGEISQGFWSPESPWETAALRKVFDVENIGVDIDREHRLPEAMKK